MIGKKIKDIMINEGLTQEELAKLINSDRSIISRWIKGERKPSAKNLKKISEVLNIPVSYFFDKSFSVTSNNDKNLNAKIQILEKKVSENEKEIKLLKKENLKIKQQLSCFQKSK